MSVTTFAQYAAATAKAAALPAPAPLDANTTRRIDLAMLADKLADGYGLRQSRNALQLQIQSNPQHWGLF
jgi:hypothetical protein